MVRTRRVPVAITTRFYRDGALFTDMAIYYIVYRVEGGGLFEGRELRLLGLSRLEGERMSDPGTMRRRLDALWPVRPGQP